RVQTLLLAGGEIVPNALIPVLPGFLDRGGLLVTLGGAPFRRSATLAPDGAFELDDDASAAATLCDELRIALARIRPAIEPLPPERKWTFAPIAPELADRFAPTLEGALFTERTGM